MGVGFGIQYFDHNGNGVTDPSRPWLAFTKQSGIKRVPPGVRRQTADRTLRTGEREEEEPVFGVDPQEDPEEEPAAVSEPSDKGEEGSGDLGLGVAADTSFTPPDHFASLKAGVAIRVEEALDALEVSAGAWIYLSGSDRGARIKTILSSRAGGCAVDNKHRGWSLMVNNWESGDRALVLEWRDSTGSGSGCARLSSEPGTIPYDKWVHVGFAFAKGKTQDGDDGNPKRTPGKAMLFLDGELLRTGTNVRRPVDVQLTGPTAIGSTADEQYPFVGRLAHVYVVSGVITPKQLAATMKVTDSEGWGQFATAAHNRLLGLFLLSGPKTALTPSDLAWRSKEGESVVDLQSKLDGLTYRANRYTMYELTGKVTPIDVDPVGVARPKRTRPQVKQQEEEGGEEQEKEAAPGGSNGRKTEEAGGKKEDEEEEVEPVEVPQPAAKKQYTDESSSDKVPASIARGSIPGKAKSGDFDFTHGGNQWIPKLMRVPKGQADGSTSDPAALAAGTFSDDVSQEELAESDRQGRIRAARIRAAMSFIWSNYEKHAWGMDELKPQSGRGDNNWAGVGMTLLDSLDTLWIMGMKEEFARAREWVATSLDFNKHASLSVFETTIRALGGLLAAYDLSGDKLFLTKAKDLGDRLMPAFNTPTGIPRATITLATGAATNPSWTGGSSILSELGTLQVEFRYLSKAAGQAHYGEKAEAVIRRMDTVQPAHGLYPIYISSDSGTPTTSSITFGALGDSFYEYLIKVWVQGGRQEAMYRRMYDAAMEGMTGQLLKRTRPSNLAYVADWDGAGTVDKMDHLVCFVPGMLALGAYTAGGTPAEEKAVRDLINAKALTYTCWQMYERHATGIAPEYVEFPGGGDLVAAARAPFYILRPEAAESLYILHQLTGNPIYREWGWKMFSSIEKYCKTQFGFGAHPDVRDPSRTPDDRMESFFLAETLKYLYMLQSPDHPISLDKYVFNTEAHPLSTWDSERWKEL